MREERIAFALLVERVRRTVGQQEFSCEREQRQSGSRGTETDRGNLEDSESFETLLLSNAIDQQIG